MQRNVDRSLGERPPQLKCWVHDADIMQLANQIPLLLLGTPSGKPPWCRLRVAEAGTEESPQDLYVRVTLISVDANDAKKWYVMGTVRYDDFQLRRTPWLKDWRWPVFCAELTINGYHWVDTDGVRPYDFESGQIVIRASSQGEVRDVMDAFAVELDFERPFITG